MPILEIEEEELMGLLEEAEDGQEPRKRQMDLLD
jgi:hypothetical protein